MLRDYYDQRFCPKCKKENNVLRQTFKGLDGHERCDIHYILGPWVKGATTDIKEAPIKTILTLDEFAREVERD